MTDTDKHKDSTPLLSTLTSPPATNIVQEQQEKIFMNRKKSLEKELEWLKGKKVVSEALELDTDSWAMIMIAANLGEKRTVIMEEQRRQQQQKRPLNTQLSWQQQQNSTSVDSSTENSRSSAGGVVGWKDIMESSKARKLEMSQRKELDELQEKKLVLKSLQDRHQRFEETAQVLFGRRESSNKSQTQKRSGNILVSVDDEDDEGLQNRVKQHTQTLLDVVFRVPSARKKMHKKLLTQTRQEAEERVEGHSQNRFSKSADHIKFEFDPDSSSGTSAGSKYEKIKRSKKKAKRHDGMSKSSTLPHIKKLKGNYQKAMNANHINRKDILGKHLGLEGYDTLEEVSEGEGSVASSAGTLRSGSALMKEKEKLVSAPSPLQISSTPLQDSTEPLVTNNNNEAKSPLTVEFDGSTAVYENRESEDEMTRRESYNRERDEEDDGGCDQRENGEYNQEIELHLVEEEHLEISTVQGSWKQSLTIERKLLTNETSIDRPVNEAESPLTNYGGFPGQQSLSDSSATSSSFLTQSSINSSIKSTDGEVNDQLWGSVQMDDVLLSRSVSIKSDEAQSSMEIPVLPPAANGCMSIESTRSWLDRYISEPGIASKGLSSDPAQSGDDDSNTYPLVSDVSFTTDSPSDPGITPFVYGGSEHPLSTADFSDLEFEQPVSRWKGSLVDHRAWEDPAFREYAEMLDHEPTNEDVILFKMSVYSEEIEERFESNLKQIVGEVLVLAMKDQLSFMTYSKLSNKLALQARGLQERAYLVAVLGRNLLEKLPSFQEQIMGFTSRVLQECYFYSQAIMDIGSSTDLSEFHSDYDDWKGTTASVEIQNTILQENAPFIEPVENIPMAGPDIPLICSELPPFPPNRELYVAFLMLPRPRIKQARSVEVLFKEEDKSVSNDDIDGGEAVSSTVETALNNLPNDKFTAPKRTVSESSFLDSDARKSSVCSVFDGVSEDLKRKKSLCENGIIKADTRDAAWEHLRQVETGETGTLPRPIVFSTSSTESSKRPPSRHSSLESIESSSSSDTTDVGGVASGRSQSPMVVGASRKMSGLGVITEEHEYSSVTVVSSSTADGNVTQVNFEHIQIIKANQPPQDDSENNEGNKEPNENSNNEDQNEDPVNEPPEGDRGRRRSSAELFTEMAAPTLTVGLPIVVIAISAFKNIF